MRHAVVGSKPGTQFYVNGKLVATNGIDGGASFTEEQLKDLKARGYEVKRVDDEAPAPAVPEVKVSKHLKSEIEKAVEKVLAKSTDPLKKSSHKPE